MRLSQGLDDDPGRNMNGPDCLTERLRLRPITLADAGFLLRLVNQASWIRFIGDRKVHTVPEAEQYIDARMIESYRVNGYGLYVVELKPAGEPIGLCGLVKRPYLEQPDIGYAFLDEHAGRGYAAESATAIIAYARTAWSQPRLLAITTPDNERSARLLLKVGFHVADEAYLTPEGSTVKLYRNWRASGPSG
jgi:[ribosomal protein S5]-alanine N-acetyltransferase